MDCNQFPIEPKEKNGTILIKISNAPFPAENIEDANVTINKIEIRNKNNESDGNPFLIILDEEKTFNLLELRNGITAEILQMEILVGNYDLFRLYVKNASIKLIDDRIFELKVPSGDKKRIKIFIKPEIIVQGGLTSELLLDFDLNKSFKVRGNPKKPSGIKGFIFKPVIRAANLSTSGQITGLVMDAISSESIADATVWIEQDSVITSTITSENGEYALIGIPAGIYSIYATKADYDTASVSTIEVIAGNNVKQDFLLTEQTE